MLKVLFTLLQLEKYFFLIKKAVNKLLQAYVSFINLSDR